MWSERKKEEFAKVPLTIDVHLPRWMIDYYEEAIAQLMVDEIRFMIIVLNTSRYAQPAIPVFRRIVEKTLVADSENFND